MTIKLIQVFIASPSDTANEREIANNVINELNISGICERLGIRLETKTWEKSTYPAVGSYPQDVINKQIGEYDLFIGIMWKKFGSLTPDANSATEEEFNIAYSDYTSNGRCKQIMFFFNNAAIPQDADFSQFEKIKKFKQRIGDELGVYYVQYDNFESDFRSKITQYITSSIKQETAVDKIPEYSNTVISISDAMLEYLSSIDVTFTHPRIDSMSLDDIYVPHNLMDTKKISREHKKINIEQLTEAIPIIDNRDEDNACTQNIKYLIVGGETSGKSTICKYLYNRYFQLNLIPILISGNDFTQNIRIDKLLEIVNNKIADQYSRCHKIVKDIKSSNSDFVLIIDDFQKATKGNEKYWKTLVKNLESIFPNLVIIGDNNISTNDLTASPPFKNFDKYIIMEFGATLRNKLIEKWSNLGVDSSIEDINEILRRNDELNTHIKTILGKNYIPSYPFYILGILQACELGKTANANYSIHGFYYEMLINAIFAKHIPDNKDISFYYNFLTAFCFYLFNEIKIQEVNVNDFDSFFESYCKKHDIDVVNFSLKKVKSIFKLSGLIHFNHSVRIDKSYIYYFFIAKYIANNIDEKWIQDIVFKLNKRLFREQYASIIMFVTHLSKSKWIINNLLSSANSIFNEVEPLRLEEDIQSINNLIIDVPKQVIKLIGVNKEREEKHKEEENIEEIQKEFENDTVNYAEFSLEDDLSTIDIMAQMNLALKTIDILGQIAKKYWGELESQMKYDIALTTYNLGLRTLGLYYNLIDTNQRDIARYISSLVIEKYIKQNANNWDATLNKDKIEQMTNNVLIGLCYLSSWGVIKRVSNAIGYDKLNLTFTKVLAENPYNAYKLINLSIDLNYKGLPIKEIKDYSKEMNNNKMCFKLLQDLVIDHMYMFEVGHMQRSQINDCLKIDIQRQRVIQESSQVKK